MRFLTRHCPRCLYFEANHSDFEKADAFACYSPKWLWTAKDNAEWLAARNGVIHEWSLKDCLPPFRAERHCYFANALAVLA